MQDHRTSFALDLPFKYIQAIRLAHAIMESNFRVHIPETQAENFAFLGRHFPLEYGIGTNGLPTLPSVTILHREAVPKTTIGTIERPLIFPQAVVKYCRTRWPKKRSLRFSFRGKLWNHRKEALENWARTWFPDSSIRLEPSQRQRLTRRILWELRRPYQVRFSNDRIGLTISATLNGHTWPVKIWDTQYYETLLASQFVLCPNGQFIWTYRFFEAVLCGAIPIVEESCDAYSGFDYFTMDESLENLKWSHETAEKNYEMCLENTTVPNQVLDGEIRSLLGW